MDSASPRIPATNIFFDIKPCTLHTKLQRFSKIFVLEIVAPYIKLVEKIAADVKKVAVCMEDTAFIAVSYVVCEDIVRHHSRILL